MKINDRLKKIGDLVDPNSKSIDIGCDHALLDIYLVKEKKQQVVVASDIAEGPYKIALENVKKYNVEENIEVRLGNGLEALSDDLDTIIISGMGGRTIIGIFKYQLKKIKNISQIILSPNNYQEDVRKFFSKIGFFFEEEVLVKEGKIIYQIMKLKRGKKKYSKDELFFGPCLLKNKDRLFYEYYQKELASRKIMMELMPKKYRKKRWITKKEIKKIEKEIEKK